MTQVQEQEPAHPELIPTHEVHEVRLVRLRDKGHRSPPVLRVHVGSMAHMQMQISSPSEAEHAASSWRCVLRRPWCRPPGVEGSRGRRARTTATVSFWRFQRQPWGSCNQNGGQLAALSKSRLATSTGQWPKGVQRAVQRRVTWAFGVAPLGGSQPSGSLSLFPFLASFLGFVVAGFRIFVAPPVRHL